MLSATGFLILTRVESDSGLPLIVMGSVVFSLGLGPVFILATDLIMGSAPPERAGAASAISETGAEFGGALGIALLGTLGTAVYRSSVADAIPPEVPAAAAAAARDTLGGALAAAQQLPDRLGSGLADAATEAFTKGLHLTATVGAVVAIVVAIAVATLLRDVRSGTAQAAPESGLDPAMAEA